MPLSDELDALLSTTPARSAQQEPGQHQTAVYRVFADDGALLYVGMALNLEGRFARHQDRSGWITETASITVEWWPSRPAARAAELEAIRSEHPRYNISDRAAS